MKKLSLWISSAASLFMLVLVVIGIVKVSMAAGKFDFGGYFAYHNDEIWGSILHKIVLLIVVISLIAFIVVYIRECSVFHKIMMIISVAIPVLLFGASFTLALLMPNLMRSVLVILAVIIGLVPIISIINNDDFRYKFISFLLMSLWAGLGLYFAIFFLGAAVLYGIFLIVASIVGRYSNKIDYPVIIERTKETIKRVFLYD